jgi:hypothetical protein
MTSVEKRQKTVRDKNLRRLRRKREQRTRLDRLIRSRQPVTPPQGLADQLDLLAETTAPFDERFSTHAISTVRSSTGTITGKLYYLSWFVRWWTGGPFMRRKLLVSVAAVIVPLAVIMWLSS